MRQVVVFGKDRSLPSPRPVARVTRRGWAVRFAIGAVLAWSALTLLAGAVRAEPWPDPDTVKKLIVDRAAAHGVDPSALLCTDWRESRFQPSARGRLGERGVAQWLPGRGNAWDETSAYRLQGIDIVREYERGNPDAPYFDVDGQAELFARGERVRRWHWRSTYTPSCTGGGW